MSSGLAEAPYILDRCIPQQMLSIKLQLSSSAHLHDTFLEVRHYVERSATTLDCMFTKTDGYLVRMQGYD